MPAKFKFKIGDVAVWAKPLSINGATTKQHYSCIIVDFKQDGFGRGYYRVVRTMHPVNGATYGEAVWVQPHYLDRVDDPNRYKTALIYRANERMEERGCRCNCCAHQAIARSEIMDDGTFKWDSAAWDKKVDNLRKDN